MGYFLPFYPLHSAKYQNFTKMKKTSGDIIFLHWCNKNYDQMVYGSWDIVCNRRMDRWMDGWKKWHTEVGTPARNKLLIFINSYMHGMHTIFDGINASESQTQEIEHSDSQKNQIGIWNGPFCQWKTIFKNKNSKKVTLFSHKLKILVNVHENQHRQNMAFYKIIIWIQTIIFMLFVHFVYYDIQLTKMN